MQEIDLTYENFDILKTYALEHPHEALKIHESRLKATKSQKHKCLLYYLLSFSHNSLKNQKEELFYLNAAFDFAKTPEEKIRVLVRRGGYYLDASLNINAYKDLTLADELYETNACNAPNILLSINICKAFLFMKKPSIFRVEKHIEKLTTDIELCTDKYIIAHFYKTLGLYFIRQKDFMKADSYFTLSHNQFKDLNKSNELLLLSPFRAICKYKINDASYINFKSFYEDFLNTTNDKLIVLRYLVAILNCDINPLTFYKIPNKKYFEIIDYSIQIENFQTASFLYYYLAIESENKNEFDLAITYFKKQSEYNIKSLQDQEEYKLIELQIHREIQLRLNAKESNIENSNPEIIKTYVNSNFTPFVAKELEGMNYQIMSNLLIDQFKTQVSICTNYGIKFLETNNIQVLESDGNYTILYDKDAKRHISSKPLAYYEKQLDPKIFLRTHRSYIINKNYIVHFFPGRVGKIELSNGLIIEVSARKMAEVRKRILS